MASQLHAQIYRVPILSGPVFNNAITNQITCYNMLCFVFPEFLRRDLNLCNLSAFSHRESASKQHKEVYGRLHTLDDFVPKKFLASYKNPCWWSVLQPPPPELQSRLQSTRSISTPIFPRKKSLSVVNHVLKEANNRETFTCLPAIYLAGFAKSGTTTLYDYITTHPLLRRPSQKEGHFWRSLLSIPMNHTNKQMQVIWYMQHFSKAAQYIESHPAALTIDASASTMWIGNPLYGDSDMMYDATPHQHPANKKSPVWYENQQNLCFVPMAVHSVLPDSKFVVIMRNPVKRLFSDFWYFCDHKNGWHGGHKVPQKYMDSAPEIFHNLTVRAIDEHRRCLLDSKQNSEALAEFDCVRRASQGYQDKDSCFPLRLGVGMYYYHIVKWMNVYPRKSFHFLRLEDMADDHYGSVTKIWKFMGFSPISKATFESELKKTIFNEMNWIKLPKYKDRFYMLPKTEKLLNSFYEPANIKLAHLLKSDDYLWN